MTKKFITENCWKIFSFTFSFFPFSFVFDLLQLTYKFYKQKRRKTGVKTKLYLFWEKFELFEVGELGVEYGCCFKTLRILYYTAYITHLNTAQKPVLSLSSGEIMGKISEEIRKVLQRRGESKKSFGRTASGSKQVRLPPELAGLLFHAH